MRRPIKRVMCGFSASWLVCLAFVMPAWAQETQSISLKSGWNLVWFAVDPVPNDPAVVLGGLAGFEGVWSFVTGASPSDKGYWVSYDPGQPAFVNTLTNLQGGRGYLIFMKTAATLSLSGSPVTGASKFPAGRSTLFGLHLPPGQPPPTFSAYFSFPDARGKILAIYKLTGSVFSPISPLSPIESDVSYWITFASDLVHAGPFRINAPSDGYQFGKRGYIDQIVIEVPYSTEPQKLTIQATPVGNGDATWLEYESITPATPEKREWKPLTDGTTITVASGQTRAELTIRANRAGRAPALYQAGLQVSLVEGQSSNKGSELFLAGMEVESYYGVYIGQARLRWVSTLASATQPATRPSTEAAPLVVPLILSLPDPDEGGPMQLLDEKVLTTARDGRKLAYRYSSILFPWPVTLTATTAIDGNGASGVLDGTLVIGDNDPLNPYRHRYNPEHVKGYQITRQIKLEFSAEDQDPLNASLGLADSAGNNELTGMYTEVISGISLNPITVSGPFKLRRATRATIWQPPAPMPQAAAAGKEAGQ